MRKLEDVLEVNKQSNIMIRYIYSLIGGETPFSDNVLFTGSQLFGDAEENSDWDFVVLVEKIEDKFVDLLEKEGFEECGPQCYSGNGFHIVRRRSDNLNLIITECIMSFSLWQRCNNTAELLHLDKQQRAILFYNIID